jgi:transcriptional regulator with XRE-family HTH domain
MAFKENLRNLREEKGMKQDALAEALNVSSKTVSHWETGYSEPSIAQLLQLADLFQITLDELMKNE